MNYIRQSKVIKRNFSYNSKTFLLPKVKEAHKTSYDKSRQRSLNKSFKPEEEHHNTNTNSNNNSNSNSSNITNTPLHKRRLFIPIPKTHMKYNIHNKHYSLINSHNEHNNNNNSLLLPPLLKQSSAKIYHKTKQMIKHINTSCNDLQYEIKHNRRIFSASQIQNKAKTVNEQIEEDIKQSVQQESVHTMLHQNKLLHDKFECLSKVNEDFAANAGNRMNEIFNKNEYNEKQSSLNINRNMLRIKQKQLGLKNKTDFIMKRLYNSIKQCYKVFNTVK
jgi:hypothetical protein